jgi:hypothetical protein
MLSVYIPPPPNQLLNGCTNFCETWYVCHDFSANPSHQLYLCVPPIFARHWLGKHVPAATNTRSTIEERVVFYADRVISKGSRRLFYIFFPVFSVEVINIHHITTITLF